jgi:hypothetical protein
VAVTAESSARTSAKSSFSASSFIGGSKGKAASDTSVRLEAQAIGIDGGDDADVILAEESVTAMALTSDGEEGAPVVISQSTAVSSVVFGAASTRTAADASAEASTTATGITGGKGDDVILAEQDVTATSSAAIDVKLESVSVSGAGFGDAYAAAATESSSATSATANAVEGGQGDDRILTEGRVESTASFSTVVKQTTVAIANSTFGSEFTNSKSRSLATGTAQARGVRGGDGKDVIHAEGDVTADASGIVALEALTVSSAGPAGADARTLAFGTATGIDGGGGSDEIVSQGVMQVTATPRVAAGVRTFGSKQSVTGEVGIEQSATATGITGGADDDRIVHEGELTVNAGPAPAEEDALAAAATPPDVSALVITVGGGAAVTVDATTRGAAAAAGILGEDGDDRIRNDGPVWAEARNAVAIGTRTVGSGVTASTHTTSRATAQGIGGGAGSDDVDNRGTVDAVADSRVDSVSTTIAGVSAADSTLVAESEAVGIDGDDLDESAEEGDVDRLQNNAAVTVSATANVVSDESAYTFAGVASASLLEARARAQGLSGEALRSVDNRGDVDVDAIAEVRAATSELAVTGEVDVELEGNALAEAHGVRGGAVADDVDNQARIDAYSRVTIDARSEAGETNWFAAVGEIDSTLRFGASGRAAGVDTAGGDDVVRNRFGADIEAEAEVNGNVDGISELAVLSFPDIGSIFDNVTTSENVARVALEATARGAALGGGTNALTNDGMISVLAVAEPAVQGGGDPDDLCTSAFLAKSCADFTRYKEADSQASASATAHAEGAVAGAGADEVLNRGLIDVDAKATATALARGTDVVGGEDQSKVTGVDVTEPDSFTDARQIGAEGGAGRFEGRQVRFRFDGLYSVVRTVDEFDVATGTFTLDDDLPAGVLAGTSYTLSVVTDFDPSLPVVFVDESLAGRGFEATDFELKWIAFPTSDDPDFATRVLGFDPDAGAFLLEDPIPGDGLLEDDVYTLSDSRNGESGAVAFAIARGMELGGGETVVVNKGAIEVDARAEARTRAEASGGRADAAAEAAASAIGIRSGSLGAAEDTAEILNRGELWVTATAISTAEAQSGETPDLAAVQSATATGIEALGGDNQVVNEGFIDVVARVGEDAPATALGALSRTQVAGATASVEAIGILTGDGNDEIQNLGDITTTRIIGGLAVPGVAIDSGGGHDVVLLADDSNTKGTVDLGPGNDTLHLVGTPSLTGSVIGREGTDTVLLDGAGAFTSPLEGFEVAAKRRAGTYAVQALPTMQRLQLEAGTLRVEGDYAMSATSSFEARVEPDGTNGRLDVAGAATLAGALSVVKGEGYYANGIEFPLVTAGLLDGAFASEDLPEPTPLLSFEVEQDEQSLSVTTSVQSFSSISEIDGSMARYLDSLSGTESGDVSPMLGELQELASTSLLSSALSELGPRGYDDLSLATARSVYRYIGATRERMELVRATRSGASRMGPLSPTFSRSRLATGARFVPGAAGPEMETWVAGLDRGPDLRHLGNRFGLQTGGVALGVDQQLGRRLFTGIGLAAVEAEGGLDSGATDSLLASAYATYLFGKRGHLAVVVTAGETESWNARSISLGGGSPAAAWSEHGGSVFSALVEAGHSFSLGAWRSELFGSLHRFTLEEEAFVERGAHGMNLAVDSRRSEAWSTELGLRMARSFGLLGGRLVPRLELAWLGDFDRSESLKARFEGVPGGSAEFDGSHGHRHGGRLRTALGYERTLSKRTAFGASLMLEAEERLGERDVEGSLQLQLRF